MSETIRTEIDRAVRLYAQACSVKPDGPVADALETYEGTRDMGQAIEFGKWSAVLKMPGGRDSVLSSAKDQRAQMCLELGVKP